MRLEKLFMRQYDYLIKIFLIINFLLIIFSITILIPLRSNGYEISIYDAEPSYFWYLLIFDIFLSISIVVYYAYFENSWWVIGMLGLMFSNILILLLPVFRGYDTYGRWDISTHVGYVKDIIQFNQVPRIIYPAIHVLIVSISKVSNINEISIMNYMVPIFLQLYILFMYCLAKTVFSGRRERIIATVASSVLFLSFTNYQVFPFALSILFLPIVFYTYLNIFNDNKRKSAFKMLLIIFILFYPFFHPLTAFVLIITFIGTYLLTIIYNKKFNLPFDRKKMATGPALIGSIVLIIWISTNYSFWNNNLHTVANWFIGEATTQVESKTISTIFEKLNMKLLDILELSVKMYGHVFIYLLFACLSGIMILKRIFLHKDEDENLRHIYFLLGWFSIYNLFFIFHMFSTVLSFGFWRIIAIVIVTTPIFIGYFIGYLTNKISVNFGISILIMVLFISSTIGIFNTFPSPYTMQTNQQITKSELVGMDWYYSNKDINSKDVNIKSCFRFAHFILGFKNTNERNDILSCERVDGRMSTSLKIGLVPKHFAYTNFTKFSGFISSNTKLKNVSYMPIFKYEKIYYSDIYPQLDEFNKNDFQKLNYDISLAKIYDDSGVEIWKI